MNTAFPFGFPAPTAMYLVLYVVTLAVHVVFMNYVLAGSAWLALSLFLRRRTGARAEDCPVTRILSDWMPFAISAAITAGVAPLLFIQILYKENFYSANLLLFHPWMAIVPVLIAGFYLAYLLKSKALSRAGPWGRVAVGAGAFACFLFAAFSWTENHLLSLDRDAWPAMYGSGSLLYKNVDIFPRLGIWSAGAFPVMAVLLGWQLCPALREIRRDADAADVSERACQTIALIAAIGLLGAVVCAVVYYYMLPETLRSAVTRPLARPYLLLAVVGVMGQLGAWHFVFHRRRLSAVLLGIASAGAAATILGVSVAREALRLGSIDLERLFDHHADAASKGGLAAFLVFTLINTAAVAWCITIARRGTRTNQKPIS